ncbi:hypothetical protein An01g07670 [Aspergillus niger]|uniref:Uncharacterized protein n=2 Tax=Aspergillus niger TaxID=5061 RepID=A2Q9F2_ASPNC|nr:hypothetical protein An01g07670 [Aspergillus niger]CAK43864.1 hypothetical protein An01g07670 [Aspergillus niger]
MNRLAGCDVDSGQRISRGGGGWAMIAPRLRAERYAAESEEDLTMEVRVEEVGEKWTETKRKGKRKEKSRQWGIGKDWAALISCGRRQLRIQLLVRPDSIAYSIVGKEENSVAFAHSPKEKPTGLTVGVPMGPWVPDVQPSLSGLVLLVPRQWRLSID